MHSSSQLEKKNYAIGTVTRISGSVVFATGLDGIAKNNIVKIGKDEIIGEIVKIENSIAIIQTYEDTIGLQIGSKVVNTGRPLYANLGPGLLGNIVDGLQRPLPDLLQKMGPFLSRGVSHEKNKEQKYKFYPMIKKGDKIGPGMKVGFILENKFKHYILTSPSFMTDTVESIVPESDVSFNEILVTTTKHQKVGLHHNWPIRMKRPILKQLMDFEHFYTGQRIIDTFFPLKIGGNAIISGGFGTGKTVFIQSLSKFSIVDIVVVVLIGERGNEVANSLNEYKELKDSSGNSLMNRTVLIVNTSNMPVSARESSIYLGITIAEYFRDQGYNVALVGDSLSRWAEAIREISGRLEEIPGEEGYPSYMGKTLGELFERAGKVNTLNYEIGSLTFLASVSPPGGDFSETVTQSALKVVGAFYALNTDLARARHFPAVDWKLSFSLYGDGIANILKEHYPSWQKTRLLFLSILKQEEEIERSVRLLGRDSLSEDQKCILDMCSVLKRSYLQQNAYDEIDKNTSMQKQILMMEAMKLVWELANQSIKKGDASDAFFNQPYLEHFTRMWEISEFELEKIADLIKKYSEELVSE